MEYIDQECFDSNFTDWSLPRCCSSLRRLDISIYGIDYAGQSGYLVSMRKNSNHTFATPVLGNDRKCHDDVIKWTHFPRYWPFHRSPANSPHKDQSRGALKLSLICVRINGWVNNRETGDLRRNHAHCDVIVTANKYFIIPQSISSMAMVYSPRPNDFYMRQ